VCDRCALSQSAGQRTGQIIELLGLESHSICQRRNSHVLVSTTTYATKLAKRPAKNPSNAVARIERAVWILEYNLDLAPEVRVTPLG
jgi:hypothetical protein